MNQIQTGTYKSRYPLIAQARLDPAVQTFAAIALLPLPADLSWYSKLHRTSSRSRRSEDAEEQPPTELLNTLRSLLEAAFIALFGTCQQDEVYMRLWRAAFGEEMDGITGANVRTGIEGNFEATRHLRHFVCDEKLTLRRHAYLERIGPDVWYRDGQKDPVLVGRHVDSLHAFLRKNFVKVKTVNEALMAAQVDLASDQSDKQTEVPIVFRVCRERFSKVDSWALCFKTPYKWRMRVPTAMHNDLGLKDGKMSVVELKFESENGWFPFQRVTDAEAELVEGTVALLRAEDTSTGKKSEWVRFCSLAPSAAWTQLHRVARQLREDSREASGPEGREESEEQEEDEEGEEGSEIEDENDDEEVDRDNDEDWNEDSTDDSKTGDDADEDDNNVHQPMAMSNKALSLQFRRIFETMRRGSYATTMTLTPKQQLAVNLQVVAPTPGAPPENSNITLPTPALPEAVREGTEDLNRYKVFLHGTTTALRFFIKKDAILTERPDLALFQPVTARGKHVDKILNALAILHGQEPRSAPAKRTLLRADTLARFKLLLAGQLQNTGVLRLFGESLDAPGRGRSNTAVARGAEWQWWYVSDKAQLLTRRAGSSTWQLIAKNDLVAMLARQYSELTAAGLLDSTSGPSTAAEGSGGKKGKETAADEEAAEEEPVLKEGRKAYDFPFTMRLPLNVVFLDLANTTDTVTEHVTHRGC